MNNKSYNLVAGPNGVNQHNYMYAGPLTEADGKALAVLIQQQQRNDPNANFYVGFDTRGDQNIGHGGFPLVVVNPSRNTTDFVKGLVSDTGGLNLNKVSVNLQSTDFNAAQPTLDALQALPQNNKPVLQNIDQAAGMNPAGIVAVGNALRTTTPAPTPVPQSAQPPIFVPATNRGEGMGVTTGLEILAIQGQKGKNTKVEIVLDRAADDTSGNVTEFMQGLASSQANLAQTKINVARTDFGQNQDAWDGFIQALGARADKPQIDGLKELGLDANKAKQLGTALTTTRPAVPNRVNAPPVQSSAPGKPLTKQEGYTFGLDMVDNPRNLNVNFANNSEGVNGFLLGVIESGAKLDGTKFNVHNTDFGDTKLQRNADGTPVAGAVASGKQSGWSELTVALSQSATKPVINALTADGKLGDNLTTDGHKQLGKALKSSAPAVGTPAAPVVGAPGAPLAQAQAPASGGDQTLGQKIKGGLKTLGAGAAMAASDPKLLVGVGLMALGVLTLPIGGVFLAIGALLAIGTVAKKVYDVHQENKAANVTPQGQAQGQAPARGQEREKTQTLEHALSKDLMKSLGALDGGLDVASDHIFLKKIESRLKGLNGDTQKALVSELTGKLTQQPGQATLDIGKKADRDTILTTMKDLIAECPSYQSPKNMKGIQVQNDSNPGRDLAKLAKDLPENMQKFQQERGAPRVAAHGSPAAIGRS